MDYIDLNKAKSDIMLFRHKLSITKQSPAVITVDGVLLLRLIPTKLMDDE